MTRVMLELVLLVLTAGVVCAGIWVLRQWSKDLEEYQDQQHRRRRHWTHL